MIAAIIILFHPNKEQIDKLITCVSNQVEFVTIVDNTEQPFFAPNEFEKNPKVQYIPLYENVGIAKAQNIGIKKAIADGCDHVLLLDQDSSLPVDFISKLLKSEQSLLASGHKVSTIGPLYVDEKTQLYSRAIRNKYLEMASIQLKPSLSSPVAADYIIASGSLIQVDVLKKVGLMHEEIFINGVDLEWNFRARSMGYSAFVLPSTEMTHSIGEDCVKILGKYIMIHSPLRNRYIIRNSCYLLRVPYVQLWWKLTILAKLPCYLFIYSWYSPQKINMFVTLMSSCVNGFRGKLGKISD